MDQDFHFFQACFNCSAFEDNRESTMASVAEASFFLVNTLKNDQIWTLPLCWIAITTSQRNIKNLIDKIVLQLQLYDLFGFCLDCYTETQNSLDRFKLGSPNVRRGPCLRMMRQEYIGSFKEGEGIGRDNRSSISVMQCGIRLQRHCVHCVGTSSFFLHAIIPSLIWTSTAASPVSPLSFCDARTSVAEADAVSPNYHVEKNDPWSKTPCLAIEQSRFPKWCEHCPNFVEHRTAHPGPNAGTFGCLQKQPWEAPETAENGHFGLKCDWHLKIRTFYTLENWFWYWCRSNDRTWSFVQTLKLKFVQIFSGT